MPTITLKFTSKKTNVWVWSWIKLATKVSVICRFLEQLIWKQRAPLSSTRRTCKPLFHPPGQLHNMALMTISYCHKQQKIKFPWRTACRGQLKVHTLDMTRNVRSRLQASAALLLVSLLISAAQGSEIRWPPTGPSQSCDPPHLQHLHTT
jgi:hypothetical protein